MLLIYIYRDRIIRLRGATRTISSLFASVTNAFFLSIMLLGVNVYAGVGAFDLSKSIFQEVGEKEGIDPLLLYSVAYCLSARAEAGKSSPYPYTVTIGGKAIYFPNRDEAWEAIRTAFKESGNVSIGLMQINMLHNPQPYPIQMLDPKKNLTVGAKILKRMMSTSDDPIIGVGKYFTPNDLKSAYFFGERVWQVRSNLAKLNAKVIEYNPLSVDEESYVKRREKPDLE